jgi:MFS-type transporter involved in bile tolerance (Atg22 family)
MDENEKIPPVEYVVHEGMMARLERTIKRLWILLILLVVLLVGTNIAWIVYEAQFEDVVITAEQQVDTGSNYAVGGDLYGSETDGNH